MASNDYDFNDPFFTDNKSSIPEDWMNDPFFTGSDKPIPDNWYKDPFFNNDDLPADTDKPTNEDQKELEPWDSDSSDIDGTKTKTNTKTDSPKSTGNGESDDLLMSVEKWLDVGIKDAGKVVDIVRGDKPKAPAQGQKPAKVKSFDDVQINVPIGDKPAFAVTLFGRFSGLDDAGKSAVAQMIIDRGDVKDTAWTKADISGIKLSDILLQPGYTSADVFKQYLNLPQAQRYIFVKLIDEASPGFTIDIDPHTTALDSVHAALRAQE